MVSSRRFVFTGGSNTVTISIPAQSTTVTLSTAGETATFVWEHDAWYQTASGGGGGATVPTLAEVLVAGNGAGALPINLDDGSGAGFMTGRAYYGTPTLSLNPDLGQFGLYGGDYGSTSIGIPMYFQGMAGTSGGDVHLRSGTENVFGSHSGYVYVETPNGNTNGDGGDIYVRAQATAMARADQSTC